MLHRGQRFGQRSVQRDVRGSGMLLKREIEPHTLAIGAHPKHCSRDAPWAFAFRVCSRTLAGVVVAVQSSREVARLARVGRGSSLRLEDVQWATP